MSFEIKDCFKIPADKENIPRYDRFWTPEGYACWDVRVGRPLVMIVSGLQKVMIVEMFE